MGRYDVKILIYVIQFDRVSILFPHCRHHIFYDSDIEVQELVLIGCQLLFLHELETGLCPFATGEYGRYFSCSAGN